MSYTIRDLINNNKDENIAIACAGSKKKAEEAAAKKACQALTI